MPFNLFNKKNAAQKNGPKREARPPRVSYVKPAEDPNARTTTYNVLEQDYHEDEELKKKLASPCEQTGKDGAQTGGEEANPTRNAYMDAALAGYEDAMLHQGKVNPRTINSTKKNSTKKNSSRRKTTQTNPQFYITPREQTFHHGHHTSTSSSSDSGEPESSVADSDLTNRSGIHDQFVFDESSTLYDSSIGTDFTNPKRNNRYYNRNYSDDTDSDFESKVLNRTTFLLKSKCLNGQYCCSLRAVLIVIFLFVAGGMCSCYSTGAAAYEEADQLQHQKYLRELRERAMRNLEKGEKDLNGLFDKDSQVVSGSSTADIILKTSGYCCGFISIVAGVCGVHKCYTENFCENCCSDDYMPQPVLETPDDTPHPIDGVTRMQTVLSRNFDISGDAQTKNNEFRRGLNLLAPANGQNDASFFWGTTYPAVAGDPKVTIQRPDDTAVPVIGYKHYLHKDKGFCRDSWRAATTDLTKTKPYLIPSCVCSYSVEQKKGNWYGFGQSVKALTLADIYRRILGVPDADGEHFFARDKLLEKCVTEDGTVNYTPQNRCDQSWARQAQNFQPDDRRIAPELFGCRLENFTPGEEFYRTFGAQLAENCGDMCLISSKHMGGAVGKAGAKSRTYTTTNTKNGNFIDVDPVNGNYGGGGGGNKPNLVQDQQNNSCWHVRGGGTLYALKGNWIVVVTGKNNFGGITNFELWPADSLRPRVKGSGGTWALRCLDETELSEDEWFLK